MWWLRGLRAAMCRLPGPRPSALPGRVPAAAPRSAHASPAWSGTRAGLRPCLQPSRASRARASALLWGSQPSPHPSLPPGLQCCSHGFCPQPQTTGPPVSKESRGHWRAKGGLPRPTALPSPALEEVAGWGQGSQAGMWGSQPTNQARVLRQGPWPSRRARLCRVACSLPPVPPPAGASGTADRCRARSPHRGAPRAPRTHASPWPRAPHPGRAGCQGSQGLPAGRYGPQRSMTACRQWPEHSHLRPGPLPVPGPPSPSQASWTRGPACWRCPDVQARRASARLTGRQVSAPLPSGHSLLRA